MRLSSRRFCGLSAGRVERFRQINWPAIPIVYPAGTVWHEPGYTGPDRSTPQAQLLWRLAVMRARAAEQLRLSLQNELVVAVTLRQTIRGLLR